MPSLKSNIELNKIIVYQIKSGKANAFPLKVIFNKRIVISNYTYIIFLPFFSAYFTVLNVPPKDLCK